MRALEPYQLSPSLRLNNRVAMAPMTRCMSDAGLATSAMAAYYARRADAGLIITEGTIIAEDATGYRNVPGIYTPQQAEAWAKVTAQVNQAGGKIFCQLWHVGRVSHPFFLNGKLPVSASATTMSGPVKREQGLFYGPCRALAEDEIEGVIDQFQQAAIYAKQAGFDGVEIHGANGYLIDQFLHSDTNRRRDHYGGSAENNARFALAVVDNCLQVFPETTAIRLSPGAYLNEIRGMTSDKETFIHLLQQLNQRAICYVHTGSFDDNQCYPELDKQTMTGFMRQHYQGKLIACGGYNPLHLDQALAKQACELIALGRPFIANPDLISKLQRGDDLNPYDPTMLASLI